jgi:hypothetical protein
VFWVTGIGTAAGRPLVRGTHAHHLLLPRSAEEIDLIELVSFIVASGGQEYQSKGFHGLTELHDLVALIGVGERFIDTLSPRFENRLVVNGFRRRRNLLLGPRPSLG